MCAADSELVQLTSCRSSKSSRIKRADETEQKEMVQALPNLFSCPQGEERRQLLSFGPEHCSAGTAGPVYASQGGCQDPSAHHRVNSRSTREQVDRQCQQKMHLALLRCWLIPATL